MPGNNNDIKQYTAEDIQRYIQRQMTPAEMYALEKASLDDPFLAEAIEGYMISPVASVPDDIDELKERLAEKDRQKVVPLRNRKTWWAAAAAILVIMGSATTWYLFNSNGERDIAQQKQKPASDTVAPAAESVKEKAVVKADTISSQQQETSAPAKTKPSKAEQPAAAPAEAIVTDNKKLLAKQDTITDALKGKVAGIEADDKNVSASANEQANRLLKKEEELRERKRESFYKDNEVKSPNRNATAFLTSNVFKGRITDSSNKALPFVNISINNSANNTYTDAQGYFKLVSVDTQLVVNVKSVGFETKQTAISANVASNKIVLSPDDHSLSEVVITGYGLQKKKTIAKAEEKEETEEEAEPVDGWGNYDIYLSNNKKLPGEKLNNPTGSVDVSFSVDRFGNLYNFRIEKSTCPLCNKEAIRLVKEGPKWKLTEGNVPASITLTIDF